MRIIFILSLMISFICAGNLYAVELSFLTGNVTVARGGKAVEKTPAGFQLLANDIVKTGEKSAATVSYKDGSQIVLAENSQIKIGTISDIGDSPAVVLKGSISAKFSKTSRNSLAKRKVYTPATVCAVRGTEFNVNVSDTAASRVELTEGTLEVYNPDGGNKIEAGTNVEADIGKAPVKSDKKAVSAEDWRKAKDEEFDADVPERGKNFKKRNEDYSSRGKSNAEKIEELRRQIINEKDDKDALDKSGKEIDDTKEKIEDDYYQNDAASGAIDSIINRFGKDKKKMRDEFEKVKRESNKVKELQKKNYLAIQAVKESYQKALAAIQQKFGSDKEKIKGQIDLEKVKPQIKK